MTNYSKNLTDRLLPCFHYSFLYMSLNNAGQIAVVDYLLPQNLPCFQIQIVDRGGIRVLRDPFTTKGRVKFYTTKRVGGDVVNFEAVKLLRFAAAVE